MQTGRKNARFKQGKTAILSDSIELNRKIKTVTRRLANKHL